MRFVLPLFSILLFSDSIFGQNFHFVIEKDSIPLFDGLQSFAWAEYNGEWILMGGRTDGCIDDSLLSVFWLPKTPPPFM